MEQKRYADVILDITLEKLDRPFSYLVPPSLEGRIGVGSCVIVPFGKGNTPKKGYVTDLKSTCAYAPEQLKSISSLAEKEPSAETRSLELAAFLRRTYGGTLAQALKCVLPAKVVVKQLEKKKICAVMDREHLISLKGEALRKHQQAKVRLLDALLEEREIPYEWVTGKLGVSPQTVLALEKAGAVHLEVLTMLRNPVRMTPSPEARLSLSPDQQRIIETIGSRIGTEDPGVHLIKGITGSGKTEVYMGLIERTISLGRQVICLIPEIALTYQTLLRFHRRFGDRVSVLNSTLSPGEKYDQCQRAKNGEIDIIIGPRSALFTPFPNLGLIVMDEEHESSYKSENTPKYHAREVAAHLAKMTGAAFVMGSATPSLEAYEQTRRGEAQLYELTERLTGGTLPEVEVVDLRKELREGNRNIFSRRLLTLLQDRLEKGEQSILFLNRRGYAGCVSCRSCGEVIKCPHCDVSLSEHYGGRLLCHYCGYETVKPSLCPACGSKYLAGFHIGTEGIEEKLKALFPGVKTLRMDRDTTRTKDSYEKILAAFLNEEAQILIGTQMIVKGHDFPKVTLVGVLAADLSLGMADFRSAERTFQLLTQAVGRAGRGTLPGAAVLQTYQPEHYAVRYAAAQDYEGFYEEESLYRDLSGYPPFGHMLAVQVFGADEGRTKALAGELAKGLAKESADVVNSERRISVLGPAPGNIGKVNDKYRYVLYLKAKDEDALIGAKDALEELLRGMEGRREIVQFDLDPINLL